MLGLTLGEILFLTKGIILTIVLLVTLAAPLVWRNRHKVYALTHCYLC